MTRKLGIKSIKHYTMIAMGMPPFRRAQGPVWSRVDQTLTREWLGAPSATGNHPREPPVPGPLCTLTPAPHLQHGICLVADKTASFFYTFFHALLQPLAGQAPSTSLCTWWGRSRGKHTLSKGRGPGVTTGVQV